MSILSFTIFLSGTVYISTIPTSKAIDRHSHHCCSATIWCPQDRLVAVRIFSTSRLLTWTSTLALNLESTNLDGGNLPMVSNDIICRPRFPHVHRISVGGSSVGMIIIPKRCGKKERFQTNKQSTYIYIYTYTYGNHLDISKSIYLCIYTYMYLHISTYLGNMLFL